MSRLHYLQLPTARLINGLTYTSCFKPTARSCSPVHSRWLQSSSGQRRNGEWTQDELNQLRALLAEGKRTCHAASALKRSRYAILQVAKFDAQKKGWWTPERPEDVFKFRQNNDIRRLESGEFDVEDKRTHLSRNRWTEAEYLRALEMRESGMSLQETADALGRPFQGVRNQFQRRNSNQDIPFAADLWTSAEDEQILALRKDGHSPYKIHEAMPHRTLSSIRRRLDELRSDCVTRSRPKRWEEEELALLCDLRSKWLGWKEISAQMPGRSPMACRVRYSHLKLACESKGGTANC
ncbi:hypothetical protein CERZMDRAFT_98777 [Cercospora zeae-maydis SCOH1-5]|uniref:Myb-like domain-containing protein n=1 Tax=Cercospora zeae-maydis SCOH1-5 TaxID=717836 RepID=A0A6A6FCC4_9PEZI|nr:hypothetical protein CERZMDRAFT_98777 [Cercospora zeae-maydis SCOH1-5]